MSSNPETSNHNSSSSSIEEDIPPYPWGLEGSAFQQALENRWDAQDRKWNAHVPFPAERDLVSPFIDTSDEEDDDEDDDLYNPNMPDKPQSSCPRRSRRRRLNPPLPAARKIVLGLPCIQRQIVSSSNIKGKEKAIEGKGKAKVE